MAKLSDKQYAAIAILSLPRRGDMTYEQIAEEVGVDDRTLRRWRNNDDFNDELKRTIMRNTLDRLPDVMASIPDHIINDGNAAMFRTFLQAHGLLTEKHELESKGEASVSMDEIKARIALYREEGSDNT